MAPLPLICFIFIYALSLCHCEPSRHRDNEHHTGHHDDRERLRDVVRGLRERRNPTRTCLQETQDGEGGCRAFQACCARLCGGGDYSVRCAAEDDQVTGQCTCNEESSPAIPPPTDDVPCGDGDDDNPDCSGFRRPAPSQPSSAGNCGRPAISPRTAPSGQRIVGGDDSVAHSWPWQVSIQLRNGHHLCGGSLLDSKHVVTAAHCFQESNNPSQYKAILGLHNRRLPGSAKSYNVETIIKHENYNSPNQHSNDIAILRLAGRVEFSNKISPVCLPERDPQPNRNCTVTGWGDTRGTGDRDTLQQVDVPIVSSSECNDRRHYRGAIDDTTMLCAGAFGRDSCQGDSGGPLVCKQPDNRWVLQGIVSWGVDCGAPNKPGVYTRVNALKDWINEQLTY